MHLLIAPNAFKNSLSAAEAARAIQHGLDRSRLKGTNECHPVGDGGDGTGDLLIERLHARKIAAEARDPLGRKISTYWGLAGNTAVIEMANASGLRLLEPNAQDPLHALSAGTGDLIRAALDQKVQRIILGMGGSATVDGGTGILQGLGARFLNAEGQPLSGLPGNLMELASIDTSGLDPRLAGVELTVLCDVQNPMTGPNGAAAVFGPQKGASPEAVRRLDAALGRLAQIICRQTGKELPALPRGGTAGGAAAGLYGLLSARLVDGIDYFLTITGFDEALDRSDWVITGEGSIDEQTLQGKGPLGVASRAKRKGVPVIGLAGRLPAQITPGLKEYFDILLPITPEPLELAEALRQTAVNLEQTAFELGNWLAAR